MNVPPLLSNLPILKLFKSAQPSQKGAVAETKETKQSQDVIQLSDAALERQNVDEAKSTASATKTQLAGSDLSLGLDPSFVLKAQAS